jgi:tRNA (uracil-5-)-methyltransferase TRM9
MREDVAAQLHRINLEFYQTFGSSFADTRGRLQPGVVHLLESLPQEASVLDLGCGHGQIARWRLERGDQGIYCGIDSSQSLLALTDDLVSNKNIEFTYIDLTQPGWAEKITKMELYPQGGFDWIFAFAVMHHLPGEAAHQHFVSQSAELLSTEGRMAVSNWNFLASPRLRERILPWETVGLKTDDVEDGDYLLDWRRDGRGTRYVHHFSQSEVADLATKSGLKVVDMYASDGETGDLGLYQVWVKPEAA